MKQFKRVMAMLLTLVMTLGLFAGLTLPASAVGTSPSNGGTYLKTLSWTLNPDVVLVSNMGTVTINVLKNDTVPEDATISLVGSPEGFSLADDNTKVAFNPAAIAGGFKSAQIASYTVTVGEKLVGPATVTVRPAETMFYEDNYTGANGIFAYTDGKRGVWETTDGDAATLTQTLVAANDVWRTADGSDYASLTYSGGQAHKVTVGSDVVDNDASTTWPYVEFTFAGTGFEVISELSNETGTLLYEIHRGANASGEIVGKMTIVDTYQGYRYDGSAWVTGNEATYYQIPVVRKTDLAYGTYTVRVYATYSAVFDHDPAHGGQYDFYFDGARIFNPIEGDEAAYTYRSFREAVTTAKSLGAVPAASIQPSISADTSAEASRSETGEVATRNMSNGTTIYIDFSGSSDFEASGGRLWAKTWIDNVGGEQLIEMQKVPDNWAFHTDNQNPCVSHMYSVTLTGEANRIMFMRGNSSFEGAEGGTGYWNRSSVLTLTDEKNYYRPLGGYNNGVYEIGDNAGGFPGYTRTVISGSYTFAESKILYFDVSSLADGGWPSGAKLYAYAKLSNGSTQFYELKEASGSIYRTINPVSAGTIWTGLRLVRLEEHVATPYYNASGDGSDTFWGQTCDLALPSGSYNLATVSTTTYLSEEEVYTTASAVWSEYDGDLDSIFSGAAVMVNGVGAAANIADYLAYGPKNELYLAEGNAIVVYVNGRASEVAVGAKAINGNPTALQVYTIGNDDSLTPVLTGATITTPVAVASASERFYPITVSDIYDSGTHAERSKILLIYNPNSNPVSLTSLRVDSASGATLAVSTGAVSRGVRAVRALRAGTAVINEPAGDNETPVIPILEQIPVLTNASLSLEGLIGVHFYLTVPASLRSGYFTVNGEKATLEKVEGVNAYRVTGRVAAKEMNDPVELKFFQNGVQKDIGIGSKTNKQSSFIYTVQEYMEFVEEHADDEAYADKFTPTLTALCSAMSDYGSYAQTYFGHDAGNAADIQNAAAIAAVTIPEDAYPYTYTADTANIAYYGESVVTESETTIRFYFMLSGSVDGYAVTVNGEEGTLVKAGKYHYVAVSNIAAKDLGRENTVTVSYGEESLTISGYSVYTYLRKQLKLSTDENLINLVKAMKYYGDCAANYFPKEDN